MATTIGPNGVDKVLDGSLTAADVASAAVGSAGIQRMQLFAAKSASGTFVDFSPADGTGIPSWAKKITVSFAGLSTNGSSIVVMRLGTASGVEATGYSGAVCSTTTAGISELFSTGLALHRAGLGAAAATRNGSATFVLVGSDLWAATQTNGQGDSASVSTSGCSKQLAAALDRIRITTVNGTDTFDAGSVSILVEG